MILKRLKEPFGKAGLTVAILALVLAMAGGAYAAAALSGKQKKEVEKIAKKFAGKAGANGANGTNGAPGSKGDAGAPGSPGGAGANGISPTGASFTGVKTGSGCTEGGVEFKGANTTFACNGKKGTTGFTETLPSEKTETGIWSFGPIAEANVPGTLHALNVPVASFPIPLAAGLPASKVHYINPAGKEVIVGEEGIEEVTSNGCPGTAAAPSAAAGNLCIYASRQEETTSASQEVIDPGSGNPGAGTSGASAAFFITGVEAVGIGTWALTAP